MIRDSFQRIWILSKKNISLYIKKGPVLIFGLMFPFFMTLSWVIGREISFNQVFIGIISMTSFFTATAISRSIAYWNSWKIIRTNFSLSHIVKGNINRDNNCLIPIFIDNYINNSANFYATIFHSIYLAFWDLFNIFRNSPYVNLRFFTWSINSS